MSALERVAVTVPERAVPAVVAAFETACDWVAFLCRDGAGEWLVEGVLREPGRRAELEAALAVAAAAAGIPPPVLAAGTLAAEGWLERSRAAFPPQPIGRRILIRGTHDAGVTMPGRIALTIDAGLAFGSGEHPTTRGCLIALEALRRRGPVADIGTGSGVLALAAAALWRVRAVGVECDPWAARVAAANVRLNRLGHRVVVVQGEGWRPAALRRHAPYGVVFANIFARPLCAMARATARQLRPGGRAVLSGFRLAQARWVEIAHRRAGLVRDRCLVLDGWVTLVLRKPGGWGGNAPAAPP